MASFLPAWPQQQTIPQRRFPHRTSDDNVSLPPTHCSNKITPLRWRRRFNPSSTSVHICLYLPPPFSICHSIYELRLALIATPPFVLGLLPGRCRPVIYWISDPAIYIYIYIYSPSAVLSVLLYFQNDPLIGQLKYTPLLLWTDLLISRFEIVYISLDASVKIL